MYCFHVARWNVFLSCGYDLSVSLSLRLKKQTLDSTLDTLVCSSMLDLKLVFWSVDLHQGLERSTVCLLLSSFGGLFSPFTLLVHAEKGLVFAPTRSSTLT